MANDGMGGISLDQLQEFNRSIAEAKSMLSLQEQIIAKALEGEKKIAEFRTGSLKQYFDSYSTKLDSVAKKYSELGESFLLLDRRVTEGFRTLESNTDKSRKKKKSSNTSEETTNNNTHNDDFGVFLKELRELISAIKYAGDIHSAGGDSGDTSSAGSSTKSKVRTEMGALGGSLLDEIIKASKEVQSTLDNLRARAAEETDPALAEALGSARASQYNIEEEIKSRKEIETQLAEMRAQLTYEYTSRTNGILREEDAIAIERKIAEEQAKRLANLQEITEVRQQLEASPELDALREKQLAAEIEYEKYVLQKKYNRALTEEELNQLKKRKKEEFRLSKENLKKLKEQRKKDEEKAQREKRQQKVSAGDAAVAKLTDWSSLSKEDNLLKRIIDLKEGMEGSDASGLTKGLTVATKVLSSLVQQLEGSIDKIAEKQGFIDTRLQGSSNKKFMGSYWNQLTRDMMSVGAVTPFFKQETFAENIKTLVNQGISFDLKQRAFLMTIQEKIANTFNVADGTLLRLIRIQQEDSTAGRLGMESTLNSFLNNMYETSEYLSDVATSVRGSLEEMEALMAGAEATEVEYQVQKWMGSLYSVGMSQEAVQGIASALGQIAAGQIDGLTSGNGAGNLLVMAANDAGVPIAEILTDGINASDTNKLLQATVNYLAEIAESSKDNKVVQQQLANVFGIKASDLKAATNLASKGSTAAIFGNYKTYDNMLNQLNNMAGSMWARTSVGEMMTNIWENGQYTLASSMANNPVSYLLFKMSSLLEQTTGGIPLPFLNVMGFGVDLETTVADLIRVASLSAGVLGSIGPMISGLGNSFSGRAMLSKMGIGEGSGLTIVPRGEGGDGGSNQGGGAQTISGSGIVGNGSDSDIKNSTINEANDSKKQQMIEAKEEAESNQVDVLNMYVLKIYELLDDVASGNKSFNVKVGSYGLTNNKAPGAQGGVGGLQNNGTASGNDSSPGSSLGEGPSIGGGPDGSSSSNGFGGVSSGTGGGIDLGGWTMM